MWRPDQGHRSADLKWFQYGTKTFLTLINIFINTLWFLSLVKNCLSITMICFLWKYGPIYVKIDDKVAGTTKLIPAGCVLLCVLYFGRLRPHSPMYPCGSTWPLAANSIPYDSWGTIQTMMATPIQGTKKRHFRSIESNGFAPSMFFYSPWLYRVAVGSQRGVRGPPVAGVLEGEIVGY